MNAYRFPIRLHWYRKEEKGRKSPPSGPRYFATIQKTSLAPDADTWSVVLNELQNSNYEGRAVMSFVSDLAPAAEMKAGESFFLFEGRWPVAEARVLDVLQPGS